MGGAFSFLFFLKDESVGVFIVKSSMFIVFDVTGIFIVLKTNTPWPGVP